jgi:hypothetical protein
MFLWRTLSQVWTENHTWDRILWPSPVSLEEAYAGGAASHRMGIDGNIRLAATLL